MSDTINLSYVWVEGASVGAHGGLTIQFTAERGKPEPSNPRDRINVVIHECSGISCVVREVMSAHQREIKRVTSNSDWEAGAIAGIVLAEEADDG